MNHLNIYLIDTNSRNVKSYLGENIKLIHKKDELFKYISDSLITYDKVNIIYDDIFTLFMVKVISSVPKYLLDNLKVYRSFDFPYNQFDCLFF
mgnify:CR=1 FL=1